MIIKALVGAAPPKPSWLETADDISQSNAEIRATANAAMCISASAYWY